MKTAQPKVSRYMKPAPYTVELAASLPSALKLMHVHHIRHLPVLSHGKIVGVVSTRDASLVSMIAQAPPEAITVEDVMTERPYTATPETPLSEVVREMAKRKIGSAIIVEREQVVGVFTTFDALSALADLLEGTPEVRLSVALRLARRQGRGRRRGAPAR
jgi:acetoin utilization protein AcuB